MKKIYALVICCSLGLSGFGQIVTIPDANFKAALLNLIPAIDTNADGEIEQSEALLAVYMGFDGGAISSMEGIQNFQNLQSLGITNNPITSLDLSGLPHLTDLGCPHNELTNLILPHKTYFRLDCSYNHLTQLDLNGMSYNGLNISYNQLTSMTIPYSPFYETNLYISGNRYTSISFSAGEILEFYCNDTALTHLDLSQVNYFHYVIEIDNNPNLESINLKNNRADFCFNSGSDEDGPGEFCDFSVGISGNTALTSVCVDDISLANQEGTVFSEADYYASLINNSNVTFSDDCLLATQTKTLPVVKIYPNPADHLLTIAYDQLHPIQSYNVFNNLGQLLITATNPKLDNAIAIDVKPLKTGTYFIEIISNNGKTVRKFIKL